MKKICIIANSPFTVLNFRKELIQSFIKRGCNVTVLLPNNCDLINIEDSERNFATLGVAIKYIPLSRSGINPLSDLKLCFAIYKTLKQEAADIVLNYTIKPTIYGSIAAYFAKVKVISSNITGLGYIFTSSDWKAKFLSIIVKLQYRLALKCNAVVFFQNEDDKNLFKKAHLVSENQVCLLDGSGVDTSFYKPIQVSRKDNKTRFLFVGRLLKEKGINELIGASKKILQKYTDVEITILGGFDDNPSSINKLTIDELMVEGVINYLGVIKDQDELKGVYAKQDIFVLPSYREGTPRSTLEALAMGLPILTTDVPGCRGTVIDGYNGKLVQSHSINALYEGMKFFIKNKELLKNFGRNSRQMATDKFEVTIINQKIIATVLKSFKGGVN